MGVVAAMAEFFFFLPKKMVGVILLWVLILG